MTGPARKGSDVVVVGAGAIGLACARALALAGRRVTVLGPARRAGEATRAAGGMLSPLAEPAGPGAFLDLGLASLALWPSFSAALQDASGLDLDLRLDGKLLLALDEPALGNLRRRREWSSRHDPDARWLEGSELRAREPAASAGALAGLHIGKDGQVDNRVLADALRVAAERAGCAFVEGAAAALVASGGKVDGVRDRSGAEHAADHVVLAAGSWSGALAGLPRPLPVRPVKGQMIALTSRALPATAVETDACYVIPRRDGSVWVGATSEEVGFAGGTTADARASLRRAAAAALPELADAVEREAWDGFRPGTPDGLPVLGPDPDLEGLVHATGHYRNGILLTPVTAELVARAVAGEADARLAAFRADRFTGR